MTIETKIEQAKNIKAKIENIKQLKADFKALSDEIITHKKAEFNAHIIAEIGKVKNDQVKIDNLIKTSLEFAKKDFKDYEKCIEEFNKILGDIRNPKPVQQAPVQPQNTAVNGQNFNKNI